MVNSGGMMREQWDTTGWSQLMVIGKLECEE